MASKDGLPVWLADYLEYTQGMESPTIFHKWVALATVGLALGRRIWFSREGREGIFPGQIMVALVAASAEMRKTTAINQGRRMLLGVNRLEHYEGLARPINVLPDRASPQQVLYRLQPRNKLGEVMPEGDCVGAIVAGEMGAYFSQEGYLETLATQVTALNDAVVGQWDRATQTFTEAHHILDFRGAGETTLRNPCIGMLTGTTPVGLASELPEQARSGGFLGRTLLVYAENTDRPRNPLLDTDPPLDTMDHLIEGLDRMLRSYQGLVRLTPEAYDFIDEWYKTVHAEAVRTRPDSSIVPLTGYMGRKDSHLIRVAMCLAAMGLEAEASGTLWIKSGHAKYALHMLTEIEKVFDKCFRHFERGTRAGLQGRLITLLSKPRAMRSMVPYVDRYLIRKMHRFGYTAAEVRLALRQLVEAGELTEQHIKVKDDGRVGLHAAYRWRNTQAYVQVFLGQEAPDAYEGEEPPDGWEEEPMAENHVRPQRRSKWPAQEASDDCEEEEGFDYGSDEYDDDDDSYYEDQ